MIQMALNFYNLLQMARSRRRNVYVLDTIIMKQMNMKLLSFAEDGQIHV